MRVLLSLCAIGLALVSCNQDEFTSGDYNRRSEEQKPDKGYVDVDTKTKPVVVALPDVPDVIAAPGVPTPTPPPSTGDQTTVVVPTPVDPTPVDPTPVDPTPVDPTPVDPTPVDPTPVDPTPPPVQYETVNSDFYIRSATPTTQQFEQAKSISQTRRFKQESYGLTDVLLVVDNSNSMSDEHANLSSKLTALLSRVANSDWQIGITTTDYDYRNYCLRHLISRNTPNYTQAFSDAIYGLGVRGSNTEEGFRMAYHGLSCSSSFPRKGSTLAVVVVSDEDNCGMSYTKNYYGQLVETRNCRDNTYFTDTQLVYQATNVLGRTMGKDFTFHGLIFDDSNACKGKYGTFGESYRRLAQKTGGKIGSICASSFTDFFNDISLDISNKLNRSFPLNLGPNDRILAGTMEVRVNGSVQPIDAFSVSNGQLKLLTQPPANAQIDVSFELETDQGLLEDIVLDQTPYLGQVDVFVNGRKQPSSAYSLNGRTLRFLVDPPLNSIVKVNYEVAPNIPTLFQVEPGANVQQVFVNNKRLTGFSYDASTGRVSIPASALRPDMMIRIVYQRRKK